MTWLDPSKYEHIPVVGGTGPGTYVGGTAWKFVLHSTEGPAGSIAGTIALFQAKPTYAPHLMIDPMGTGRRVQHIPLDWSACALKSGRDGWQTNRARAIQMEICGYAADSGGWPDDALWIIADVIADCSKAGYPINPDDTPDDAGLSGTLATESAPQRMTPLAFHLFDGICAHVRVPFNDHWDCGALHTPRLAELMRTIVDGQVRTVVPRPPDQPLPPVPAAPRADFIAKGMVGGQVTFLQDLLKGLGYEPGPSDGIFGFGTEAAVKAFQRDHGLVVDGVCGPATQAAISQAYAPVLPAGQPPLPSPPPAALGYPAWSGRYLSVQNPPLTGADVRTWQSQMSMRGWRIGVDGVYGAGSEAVCRAFQAEKGLTVDGIVGRQTWNAAWTTPRT